MVNRLLGKSLLVLLATGALAPLAQAAGSLLIGWLIAKIPPLWNQKARLWPVAASLMLPGPAPSVASTSAGSAYRLRSVQPLVDTSAPDAADDEIIVTKTVRSFTPWTLAFSAEV